MFRTRPRGLVLFFDKKVYPCVCTTYAAPHTQCTLYDSRFYRGAQAAQAAQAAQVKNGDKAAPSLNAKAALA